MEEAMHNHIDREVKEPGRCPACDEYHARYPDEAARREIIEIERLIESIAHGKADTYLETILAAAHGRKRELRGCQHPYGRREQA